MPGHDDRGARRAIDAVWRIESARLIAGLARYVGDVGVGEDLAHDALASALEQWPRTGVPDNPGAWLMAVGKRRAVDLLRRRTVLERKHEELGRDALASLGGSGRLRHRVRRCRRRLRRRSSAPHLRRLPPRPLDRGPGGPDAAAAGRAHHRGDRPRLPGAGGHRGPAHRAGQAHAGRGQGPLRGARRSRAGRAPGVGARGHLPRVQRGVLGHDGCPLDATGPVRGRLAPGARPGRAPPDRARGPRVGGPDGDPGVAGPGPRRSRGGARLADGPGPSALGPRAHPARAWPRSTGPRGSAAASAPTPCRPPSPPATPVLWRRPPRTGPASRRSTTRWPS